MEGQELIMKKIVLVGDSEVGKTNLLNRVSQDSFDCDYRATIGVDFKILRTGDDRFKLQIWDTAGQERFKAITSTYFKGSHIIVFVFNVNDSQSFRNLEGHMTKTLANCDPTVEMLLIGNMNDLSDREVPIDEAEKWAIDHDMAYLDFSAKYDCKATLLSKITEIVEKHDSLSK